MYFGFDLGDRISRYLLRFILRIEQSFILEKDFSCEMQLTAIANVRFNYATMSANGGDTES
jgi:hypothetical protein